jgi:DNA primase
MSTMDIEELKKLINIEKEIGQYVKLRKKGNLLWGLCPFHEEKTSSFAVNIDKSFYHCFGCGVHGDIFTFIMKKDRLDFTEAVKFLAEKNGVKISFQPKNLTDILEKATTLYEKHLSKESIDYLKNRGLNADIIKKFKIGYADGNICCEELLKEYSLEDMQNTGICGISKQDRFRNRIVFPIINREGKTVGFSGRSTDGSQPKYLNSPETSIFHKSYHLYNENNLAFDKDTILVEGYLDVISLYQKGFQSVAAMGTAISLQQLATIMRFSNNLYVMLDGDIAGKKAIFSNIDKLLYILKPNKKIYICNLEKDMDPDSFVQKGGEIREVLSSAVPIIDWTWNNIINYEKGRTPDAIAIKYSKLDEIINMISNSHIKKAYKQELENRIKQLKTDLTTKIPVNLLPEEKILAILCKKPELILDVIEELITVKFSDENYDKIRENLINDICNNTNNHENILKKLYEETPNLQNLLISKSFPYIICNRSFALRYLRDQIQAVSSKKAVNLISVPRGDSEEGNNDKETINQ